MAFDSDLPPVALVTGAGRRLGRAIALDLADQGFAVAVHYNRSAEDAEAVAAGIREAGGRAAAFGADLGEEAATAGLVGRVAEALGPVGVLVNNASLFERDEIGSVTAETWQAHMQVNLRAPFVLTQDFANRLPAEAQGVVINMLDERVWCLTPHFVSYTVSKYGLWGLTQSLALALAPRIRVNGIGPGPALPSPRQSDAEFQAQCAAMPLERGTSPDQIAAAVRFLIAQPAMTGQMLALDGGQHLSWLPPGRGAAPPE